MSTPHLSRPTSPASSAAGPTRGSNGLGIGSKVKRVLRKASRLLRPSTWPQSPSYASRAWKQQLLAHLVAAVNRLEFDLTPALTLKRLRAHHWSWRHDGQYIFLFLLACFNLSVTPMPLILKLLMCLGYLLLVMIPLLSQFFFPATPVLSWLLLLFTCRFIPATMRPHIWVSVLPTLEIVLYGANISDILTRYTHPALDVLAWFPYGVMHFVTPFVTAAVLFVFGPPGSIKLFGKIFGYMNLTGVLIQILFPCSAPWYELIYGLTPANYAMPGSPGGLARIDKLFGSMTYTVTFTASPMVFGAFPSLHSGCATLQAFFLSHFFPRGRPFYWLYTFWMWWCTMYLTHHYLIDLVAGGFLATLFFHVMMTEEMRHLPGRHASYLQLSLGTPSSQADLKGFNGGPDTYELASDEESEMEVGTPLPDLERRGSRPSNLGDDSPRNLHHHLPGRSKSPFVNPNDSLSSRPRTPRLPAVNFDDDERGE